MNYSYLFGEDEKQFQKVSNTDENKERKTANKGEKSELDTFRKKRHKQSLFKGNVCIYNDYTSQEAEKVMNIGGTNVGEAIRKLREARGMTRADLVEVANISESHLKKIEAGLRQPGINTYQRIIEVLGIDIVIRNEEKSIKGNCIARAQEILLNSTDEQALFLIRLLEFMVENREALVQTDADNYQSAKGYLLQPDVFWQAGQPSAAVHLEN